MASAIDCTSTPFTSLSPPTAEQAEILARCMPALAARPLVPPVFLPVSWIPGQIFTAADDPDRTTVPFEPPGFLERKDPVAQRAKTAVEELAPPTAGWEKNPFARVVSGVLDEDDCAEVCQLG